MSIFILMSVTTHAADFVNLPPDPISADIALVQCSMNPIDDRPATIFFPNGTVQNVAHCAAALQLAYKNNFFRIVSASTLQASGTNPEVVFSIALIGGLRSAVVMCQLNLQENPISTVNYYSGERLMKSNCATALAEVSRQQFYVAPQLTVTAGGGAQKFVTYVFGHK